MANIYITQYARLADGDRGFAQCPEEPNLGTLEVEITSSSIQSAELSPACKFVMIAAEAPCSIDFGVDPAAVKATSKRLPSIGDYPFGVQRELIGAGCKIAVIE